MVPGRRPARSPGRAPPSFNTVRYTGVEYTVSGSGLYRLREAPIDEATLIEKARAGDAGALEALVRQHMDGVYALALRILGDPDQAEDATQNAMINAVRGIGRFRGDASFRTWILRITANAARSLGRRRTRRREVALTAAESIPGEDRDPATQAVDRAEAERVTELLQSLPPKQRMAVQLRANQGLSYAEVGEILDCSEGAARVNYHLGIKRLRELTS
jgi:RNA polymerase sigma-70 factor (ECF subfamily)